MDVHLRVDAITTRPPRYIVALREGDCGLASQSGPDSSDHLVRPMHCVSERPELRALVVRRYRVERGFGHFVVLRLGSPARAASDGRALVAPGGGQ